MAKQTTAPSTKSDLEHLISDALKHLRDLGYSNRSLKRQRIIWNAFLRFSMRKPSDNLFSHELANRFLLHSGIPNATVPLPEDLRCIRRAMQIITEYAETGRLGPRTKWTPGKLPLTATLRTALTDYEQSCADKYRHRQSTIKSRHIHLTAFLSWAASRDAVSFERFTPALLSSYVSSLGRFKSATVRQHVCSIRSFLLYLTTRGLVSRGLVQSLPKIRIRPDARIPFVWTSMDVDTVLKTVDRETSIGKRDFAILLLACRLGIRAGDIRTLRLEHLCWRRSLIERVQSKTGNFLCLPISNEVGDAIIDYLREGRPPSQCREVFLQATAPFQPFSDNCHLWHISEKYRILAGIEVTTSGQRGMHSLRHTLATQLFENETPMETIASVLGHSSIESTRIYTKVDVKALRSAALDPEEVINA
jgi:site-specific recombinase XerD